LGLFGPKEVRAAQSGAGWNLQVTNLAGGTVSYTLDQLLAMPATTVSAVLWCDEWQVAAGEWRGVGLGYLLQEAGLDSDATWVGFRATDGYEISIQLSDVLDPSVIVAYENNGSPLPEVLRLVVPWDEGWVWIDMIDTINIVGNPADASQGPDSRPGWQDHPRFGNTSSSKRSCSVTR
jgi:DMSO/TMAO reductase YedYZ molybdopterin-dependent catalytic subunit